MFRRDFLRSLALNAAGLYVAPDALEAILEPRRKYWPGWSGAGDGRVTHLLRVVQVFRDDFDMGYSVSLVSDSGVGVYRAGLPSFQGALEVGSVVRLTMPAPTPPPAPRTFREEAIRFRTDVNLLQQWDVVQHPNPTPFLAAPTRS